MKFTISTLLLLLLVLTGCTYSLARDVSLCPPCEDTAVASSAPCQPCWEGLLPGRSTQQDVLEFIDQSLSEKESDEALHAVQFMETCRNFSWKTRAGSAFDLEDRSREIHVEQGLVSYIEVGMPLLGPTMQQVIDEHGLPEYVYSALAVGPDGQYYFLEVYYPSQGLAFQLFPSQTHIGEITPRTRVSWIEYYAPGDMISFYASRVSCFTSPEKVLRSAELRASRVQSWTGFGQIEVIEVR